MRRAIALALLLAASGCNSEPADNSGTVINEIPKAIADSKDGSAAVESKFGTPVKDRIATLGLLNKRNNLTQDIKLKPGESVRVGNVVIKLSVCERSLPWETPPQTGAFVQLFVEERATTSDPLAWHKVFSGWLFKESPSLNAVEHPVYDLWVKDCAMKFPGEEADPAAAAAPSNAAKPAAKPSAAPSPVASPTPTASASPTPAAT